MTFEGLGVNALSENYFFYVPQTFQMVSTDKCTLLCLFNSKRKEFLPWIFLFSGVKYKTLAVFSIVGRFSDNLRTVKSSRSLHKLLVSEKN